MRATRLAKIALVTQAAMNALNPVMRIEDQITDGLVDHGVKQTKEELRSRVHELLRRVGLSRTVARMYPHELSGGMRQRQVMVTLSRLQKDTGAAVILVGHDMGLVAQFADRIGVMYAGHLVELGPVRQMLEEPAHPYTKLLIQSVPTLRERRESLVGIPGMPPALVNLPSGCVFHPRCPSVMTHCSKIAPTLQEIRSERWVSCHLYSEVEAGAGT